jgi:sec-independent protein translocase protein TatA
MKFGGWEILLVIVLVLILFGGARLAGVGKNLGRGIKDFKEEIHSDDEKTVEAKTEETNGENKKEDAK